MCATLATLLFLPLIFFFNDTATTEIYTLSLHDALPIYVAERHLGSGTMQTDGQQGRAQQCCLGQQVADDTIII